MRFELLMTQVTDCCVVECDAPTLLMVLTRTLQDPLKRQYTCTRLHGVTSRMYRSWLIQTQLDFHPNQMLWTASNEI
jgi:hypothetical protein